MLKKEYDPISTDLEILAYLYDYLESLLQQPVLDNYSNGFFSQLQSRIAQLDSSMRCSVPHKTESLIGYFHEYLLIVTVKTVKISVTCAICKLACQKFSATFKERISLDQTVKYVHSLQNLILELFGNLYDLDLQKQFHNDLELYITKSMGHKLVHHLLQDCDELVTQCADCVQTKAENECLFLKVACCSVGALCVGRLLYAVYRNVSLEEMVRTGLWVTCTGVTAAVLNIPSIELQEVLNMMSYHSNQCVTMMTMIKPWFKNVTLATSCNGLNSPLMTRAL